MIWLFIQYLLFAISLYAIMWAFAPLFNYQSGFIFRLGSAWIGIHYSNRYKRWCVNLFPFVTFWFTKDGKVPYKIL